MPLLIWEIPQNYHTLALFDPTKMGNSTIPVLQYAQNPQESANIGKHAELFFSNVGIHIGEIEKQFLFQTRQAWMWLTYVNIVKICQNCNNDHVNRNEHPHFFVWVVRNKRIKPQVPKFGWPFWNPISLMN